MTDTLELHAGDAILVIGLGRSGLSELGVLAHHNVSLYATDEKPVEALSQAIAAAESFGARFVEPNALDGILQTISWAVLSPGVPPISPVVRAHSPGRRAGASARSRSPTGSARRRSWRSPDQGKSTTTALIGHLLRALRPPRLESAATSATRSSERSPVADADDWVVAEVSSFQLETIRAFKPRVAVLTQHRARPSRPLPLDGRVCRSEVPHLRQSGR